MKTVVESLFYAVGSHIPHWALLPDLIVVFFILGTVFLHVLARWTGTILRVLIKERSVCKSMLSVGGSLGFQKPEAGAAAASGTVCAGLHHGRGARFFASDWRGIPMMAVAATGRESIGLCLQIVPNFGWLTNTLFNVFTFRPRDFRTPEFRLRTVSLGDQRFDTAYRVRTNQPTLATELLTPEVQAELLAARGSWLKETVVAIVGGEVSYAVSMGGFRARSAERIAEKLDFVCALAQAMEHLTRKGGRSRPAESWTVLSA